MRTLYVCFLLFLSCLVTAQGLRLDSIFRSSELYAVNPAVSVPAIAVGAYASQQRLLSLQDKPEIPRETLLALRPEDVNGFDRVALRQDVDKHKQAIIQSDYFFNTGQVLPFGLFIWKKYRRDWFDITLMYLEAQTLQGLFYGYAPFGPTLVDRIRPKSYYEEFPYEERTHGNEWNSMFSGHVSTMSTGFYFFARMIDDYNPDLTGGQRALLYVGATVPSAIGGWLRVRGLKHYPTDTLIGLGVGAISGIGIPSLHKWWKARHRSRLTLNPVYGGGAGGLTLVLQY
ncbi:phosphatase PAP2 family protein [Neolewinella litorea]|uniref:Phosphatase PAP2 family protein n=1 Tax=Neolewinella litorea TaxID=2562452 RepID=A0A4S4N732_9BACT|nr:phosphatase PAP2 family protein [Neolewinella litorea]THH34954.1 phosphatase PAP2 family protein [Neolewinella litorea]